MAKILQQTSGSNPYLNNTQYQKLGSEQAFHKGRTYTVHTYQDLHSRGLAFKISRGFLAVLATVSLIGVLFFTKNVRQLWNEAVTGMKKYRVYVPEKGSPPIHTDASFGPDPKTPPLSSYKKLSKLEERITSMGLFRKPKYGRSEELIAIIREAISSPAIQKQYFGDKEHLGVGIIDFNQAKSMLSDSHGFSVNELIAAIRLMILRGELHSMANARCGYYVAKTEEAAEYIQSHPCFFCRDDLIQIDSYIAKHFLHLDKIKVATDKPELVAKIVDAINNSLFGRAKGNTNVLELQGISLNKETNSILDQLVLKGIIHSYNQTSRMCRYHLKLEEKDSHKAITYRHKQWRDKATIQDEMQFQKDHEIKVPDSVIREFKGKSSALKDLLASLNQRRGPGPCTVYHDKWERYKAAKFLKEKGFIHDHTSCHPQLKIYATRQDKE